MIDEHCFDILFKNGFTVFEGEQEKGDHYDCPTIYLRFTPNDYEKERIEISINHEYMSDKYRFEFAINDDYMFTQRYFKDNYALYQHLESFFDSLFLYKVVAGKINKFIRLTNPV